MQRAIQIALIQTAVEGGDVDAVFSLACISGLDADVARRAKARAYEMKEHKSEPADRPAVRARILAAATASHDEYAIAIAEELVEALNGDPEPTQGLRKGTYTVAFEAGGHATFQVARQPLNAHFAPGRWVLSRLTGPDNEADYAAIAFVSANGRAILFKKNRDDVQLVQAVRALEGDPRAAGVAWASAAKACYRCGKKITARDSLEQFAARGFLGPRCADLVNGG